MSATMTTVAGILKEVYEGQVNDQLNSEAVALKRITRSSEGVFETPGGKYVVFPVRNKRNHGISYRSEGVAMADAGRQGYAQAQETLRYGYGRAKFTGQVLELAKTAPQAFMNAADAEMDTLKDDVVRDCNRIAWGNGPGFVATGGTGVIATVSVASGGASTTITVADTFLIEPGMVIDVVDATGTPIANGTGKTVQSVTSSTAFVVDATGPNTTTAHHITRTGNWNKEPYGLMNLIDDTGTVHNINSATAGNEYWRSIDDGTTTTLTEAAMIKKCDDIRKAGGAKPSVIFCSLGVRRAYFNLLTAMRRYNEPKEWTGGLVGLAFNFGKEIPVVEDLDAPSGNMTFLTESEITVYRTRDWYWDDLDGNILKWVSGFDVYEAYMKSYWQIVTHKRNAHARFTALTEG